MIFGVFFSSVVSIQWAPMLVMQIACFCSKNDRISIEKQPFFKRPFLHYDLITVHSLVEATLCHDIYSFKSVLRARIHLSLFFSVKHTHTHPFPVISRALSHLLSPIILNIAKMLIVRFDQLWFAMFLVILSSRCLPSNVCAHIHTFFLCLSFSTSFEIFVSCRECVYSVLQFFSSLFCFVLFYTCLSPFANLL